ncbi:non-hydrolyzing UDP-N-acetylglucosamine 2-epimerase [Lutibacter flavus]|uniref:UDP-N-acetylglucosamine 2-epimerase (non-hydrolyzing) n=1 Tax=Lutibacter flavus TaxID=691689 RepID=A0A238VST4_9FLAO|nr:UDP-N-acetylglucosamine 2-epimerase (non-hydrolyzing) [Lutibacter flavus]SNR36569.1 UDP-N-acetylglucosamine 2-epimerase (non-hydrolysing) [Lutibacter flavus]
MTKILLCFGTRPEAIKMAPVYFELLKNKFEVKVCVTAQHREMLDQVLNFFEIIPDYDLNLMRKNQSLNELFASILKSIDTVLSNETFNLVLVHGDTTTSTAVSLAAFHKGIKVGHIEAGLRTYNKKSPFPEELNRQLTGRIANIHFSPTDNAAKNLLQEGVSKSDIIITGNTVIDALFLTLQKIKEGYITSSIKQLKAKLDLTKKLVLVTGHRRESFGTGFENICNAILEISKIKNVEIVYPVHLNPNVQKIVFEILSDKENIHLINPLDYPSFVWLMSKSCIIISDSGGIQEEAPSLKIPVIVTRETTERDEGIKEGFSFLVGTDAKKIVAKVTELLNFAPNLVDKSNPYGKGNASKIIVDFMKINRDL